jgi:hypothetical protein
MLNFKNYTIPKHTQEALINYVERGYEPGDFLYCVLGNNLLGAVSRADAQNLPALKDIVQFVHNELPNNCHGSEAVVIRFLQEHLGQRKGPKDIA